MRKLKKTKFDFYRLWILLSALLLVAIFASEAFAKQSSKDVESKGNGEKQQKVNVEYNTR